MTNNGARGWRSAGKMQPVPLVKETQALTIKFGGEIGFRATPRKELGRGMKPSSTPVAVVSGPMGKIYRSTFTPMGLANKSWNR